MELNGSVELSRYENKVYDNFFLSFCVVFFLFITVFLRGLRSLVIVSCTAVHQVSQIEFWSRTNVTPGPVMELARGHVSFKASSHQSR